MSEVWAEKQWKAVVASKDREITRLRKANGNLRQSNRSLRAGWKRTNSELDNAKAEVRGLRRKLTAAETKAFGQERRADRAEERVHNVARRDWTEVRELREKVGGLEDELEEVRETRDRLEHENLHLQGVIGKRESEITALREGTYSPKEQVRLERELETVKSKLARTESLLEDCRKLNTELKWIVRRRPAPEGIPKLEVV